MKILFTWMALFFVPCILIAQETAQTLSSEETSLKKVKPQTSSPPSAPVVPESTPAETKTLPRFELDPNIHPRVLHWSFQLEIGGGFSLDSDIPNWLLLRARPGIFYLYDTTLLMLGPTIMHGAMLNWGVGGQFEFINTEVGLSVQLGAETNFEQTQLNASLGYALFGLEYDFLTDNNAAARHAIMFKLRIPLGYLSYAIFETR